MRRLLVSALLVFVACACWARSAPAHGSVLVLLSQEKDYYRSCMEGLLETMGDRRASQSISSLVLSEGTETAGLVRTLEERNPRVLVTLGTQATQWAVEHGGALDVCFAMVPSRGALSFAAGGGDPHANMTGVVLQIPLQRQVDLLRSFLPGMRRIGVIYSEINGPEVERLGSLLDRSGLQCISSEVSSSKDLSAGLTFLLRDAVDVLFALPDPVAYNGASAKYVLLFSLQHRIPLVAFSANYVKGGALMGFYADPKDIGAQCGAIVNRLLEGSRPAAIPIEFPEKVRLGWNRKVAARLGLSPKPEMPDSPLPRGIVLEDY
ncbi:MAG: ABC transporter substrate-binding protein [bacterium]